MSETISYLKKNSFVLKALFLVLALSLSLQGIVYTGITTRIIFSFALILFAFISGFPFKVLNYKLTKQRYIQGFILSIPVIFILMFLNIGIRTPFYLFKRYSDGLVQTMISIVYILMDLVLSYWIGLSLSFSTDKAYKTKRFKIGLAVAAFFMIHVLYLPMDSYLGNIDDFEFTSLNFIFYFLAFFICAVILGTLALVRLKDKKFDIVYKIFLILDIGSFVQYMFLNKHLPFLDLTGNTMVWDISVLIVNTLIWIFISASVFILPRFLKKYNDKVWNMTSGLIFSYHVVAFILLLVLAPTNAFSIKVQYYFDTSGQYTVSKNDNIIVMIFDAYDNRLMKEKYEKDPEEFDFLKDFTMYTNTTSVFESTIPSVNQFAGGCKFDNEMPLKEWLDTGWNSENTVNFYNAMHDAGYKCNAYNFELPYLENGYGKFDNIIGYDEPQELEVEYFNINKFFDEFEALAFYRSMPYLVKNLISLTFNGESFKFYMYYFEINKSNMQNLEYLAEQDYITTDDNIFMINHLRGVHTPCDVDAESKNCYEIAYNLVAQFKELGIYDDSTIIFMSDHGAHRDRVLSNGSSPIFIVKQPGESHDSIQFNSAPVSLEDFMGTIAVNAGLSDPGQYGTSVYDFKEGDERVRYTYERLYDKRLPVVYTKGYMTYMVKFNAYAKYVVTDTVDDNIGINPLNSDSHIEILPMKEYFG